MERIILIGFRGSGKTATGRCLAERLHLPFVDTDSLIEKRTGWGIPEIFATHGEEGFRDIEREVIASIPPGPCVVSTGGGVVLDPENVRHLRAHALVVFLNAPVALIEERIRGSDRPPLTHLPLEEEIEHVLAHRMPLYRAAADICIDTGSATREEVCTSIERILREGTISAHDRTSGFTVLKQMSPDPTETAMLATIVLPGRDPLRRLCGILGYPCRHSISPMLYNQLFSVFRLNYYYTYFEWQDPAPVMEIVRTLDVRGLSVTIPFKQTVMPMLDEVDDHASAIGAVNTVLHCGGRLYGYNTDWIGVKNPLQHVPGKKAVVLGAGGAAAAAVYALRDLGIEVTILNRTPERGAALARRYGCNQAPLSDFERQDADIVVHATPVGMGDDGRTLLSREHLHPGMTVFDLVYTPLETPLLREAKAAGCRCIPGMEMFIHQAREQFQIFTGIAVEPDHIRELLT